MKYIIIVPDGMADYPVESLGNKTPLEYAETPNFDRLASAGEMGIVRTVPEGMVPESDTANLAIMGYDPRIYSKGRSPLEALSMGINLLPYQTAIRANLAAISESEEKYEDKIMLDHSSDEISTEEATVLIEYLESKLFGKGAHIYTGVSYRHCLVMDNAPEYNGFARPHDIIGKRIGNYLPTEPIFRKYMEDSFELLSNHPVNVKRAEKGLKKANTLWFWSPGKKPSLPLFSEKYGLRGSVICAVDLIKGIGKCAGLDVPFVKGATGGCVTDYTAKADEAIKALESGFDFVYIHIEAPDECGHKGNAVMKAAAISAIDKEIVGKITGILDKKGEEYRMMILPDHFTPVSLKTHAHGYIPFLIYDSRKPNSECKTVFTEKSASATGLAVDEGFTLADRLIKGIAQ